MRVAFIAVVGGLLSACSSGEPARLQTVERAPEMAGGTLTPSDLAGRPALVFKSKELDLSGFRALMLDPVEVYRGSDAEFSGATPQRLQHLTGLIRSEFVRAFGERYPIVAQPGPGVIRMKFLLGGLEDNVPLAATASRVLPFGLVANAANSARGAAGTFTGTVTLVGQVYDERDAIVGTFIQKRSPNALDIAATLTSQAAHEAAIADAMDDYRRRFDELLQQARGVTKRQ